jgi:predicted RNase H-like nuclease (RuvC/YqgF family)
MAADRIEKLEKYQSVHAQCDKTSLELEEKLVKQLSEARKRIQMLEAELTHIYAWWPISTFNPHQTIKEIREFARKALEGKDD